jgi:hypothetical protein
LYLERPAFWTEVADPEVWLRATEVLVRHPAQGGSPRTIIADRLRGVCSRRTGLGLFGIEARRAGPVLQGVGMLKRDAQGQWQVTPEAVALVQAWRADAGNGLEALAGYLITRSPWLRLLLLRLLAGDWSLAGRGQLRSGSIALRQDRYASINSWLTGLERQLAPAWMQDGGLHRLAVLPAVLKRPIGQDNLSLAPLAAPLALLETVGWLRDGQLHLPVELQQELTGQARPSQLLQTICQQQADVRGLAPIEPCLRALAEAMGLNDVGAGNRDRFAVWMDELLDRAMSVGAIEVLAAESGQARHGRGIGGDRHRQLVRLAIHPEFDDIAVACGNQCDPHLKLDESVVCSTPKEQHS